MSDYKILLQICENSRLYIKNFPKVSRGAMEWIYPFSQYALTKDSKVLMNKFVVSYYNRAYKAK